MYLARLPEKGRSVRFIIRQSYCEGECFRSRDLFDLGHHPERFIIYPGGNGFYIHSAVEDGIADRGVAVTQDELEPLFMPFIDPHIRRVIRGFDRRKRHAAATSAGPPAKDFHHFDRYRLYYLKTGRLNLRGVAAVPDKFYAKLACKSRDEIEYDFIAAEGILRERELLAYTFQIFNLQRHFKESFAARYPAGLDRRQMDQFFIEELCRLNRDEAFWLGCESGYGLHPHLVRYAVMYFDGYFPSANPMEGLWRDFRNRYRTYRPPESVQISLAESAHLFGVSSDTLKKMDRSALTSHYRRLAMQHHPDQGGDQETFVKLTTAYQKLLKKKSRK